MIKNLYRYLPVFNFVVGSSALCFQLTCLYPWHLSLDESFDKLNNEFNKLRLQRNNENIEKIDKLNTIEDRLGNMEDNIMTVKRRMSKLF